MFKFISSLFKKITYISNQQSKYGEVVEPAIGKFSIWKLEKNCPICESEMINLYEHHYDMYEGNYKRYRLHCINGCYVRITDDDDERPKDRERPAWKIFERDFNIWYGHPDSAKQEKAIYDALNYWKEGERYLIDIMLDGECKWKS